MILFFIKALDAPYTAFSIGTTGFKPASEDTITAFAAVKVQNGAFTDASLCYFFNPQGH
jgi:DNA polymerase III alpha subunit (gram-positive type)